MIHVIATISLQEGVRDEFLNAIGTITQAVRAERGCIEYEPVTDVESGIETQFLDSNSVVIVEKWSSLDALHLHRNAPHLVKFKEDTKEMVTGMSIRVFSAVL